MSEDATPRMHATTILMVRTGGRVVIGRYDGMNTAHLKPSNHLVGLALIGTDAPPWSTALVGDSESDIVAADQASVASIGYADKPGKAETLADAGAGAVVSTMDQLAAALTAVSIRN